MRKKIVWLVISCLSVVALLLASCAPAPPTEEEVSPTEEEVVTEEEEAAAEEEEASPTPPPDTTPPSAISGLVVIDAYDGRVNLSWDKSTAEDFDHYDIYVSKTEIVDAASMTPVHQIGDIASTIYQVSGLEVEIKYYFAVTAVDKSGNQDTMVTCVSATSTPMLRGTVDADISVDTYQSDKAWPGTTLLADNHNPQKPRIIEVNMRGEIIWEYLVPENLKQFTNPGFDVELLPNNDILFVLPCNGVYEIDRKGKIIWSYLTDKISHDADRLPNGNTIFAFGAFDQKSDAQITEVNQKGEVVWSWYAKDHFDKPPYANISEEGWTHTNAVTRLSDGNTLISLRNFNFVVEVDPKGLVIRTIGEGIFQHQHDPEALSNGNILVANSGARRQWAAEIDPKTGKIVWQFPGLPQEPTPRDADRLPNGNTLMTTPAKIVEITPGGGVVWQLTLEGLTFDFLTEEGRQKGKQLGFYKADRMGAQR